MKPAPDSFDDIHSHSLRGPRTITSVEPGQDMPGEYGRVWYSVGFHPWNTGDKTLADKAIESIDTLADDPRVVAVGEAGLDALRGAAADEQERVFLAQARIAERHRLPLIVHCVRRYGRLMELHRQMRPSSLWIVHGFRGKAELARQLTRQGIAISLRQPRPDLATLPQGMVFHDSD